MELLDGIYTRRSIRQYTEEPVAEADVKEIIKAGMWAPSGLNNQPWRFVTVRGEAKRFELASYTKYSKIIESAPACIAVFIDKEAVYHDVKDHQAIGACLQNMLLAAHALGLGAVWLGEILNSAEKVRLLLELPETLELMAVVALGHPVRRDQVSSRKKLADILIKEF